MRMVVYKVINSQYNYNHGGRMHFPYSIAVLAAYVKDDPKINQNFKFEKSYIFRNRIGEHIVKSKDADILLCSCYSWNWEITLHLAENVKRINPKCIIVFGGPQVPNFTEGFFKKYPFVDILVHGEGELVLKNIFEEYLGNKEFDKVKGAETKSGPGPLETRLDEDTLPSPYLTNMIWDLVDINDSPKWAANWETNRGCPYYCTFCDWGAATFNRTKRFSLEKLFKEIEWFGENKISYIDNCDANFGIFQERDLEIATKLKEVALKTGYPKLFQTNWAKFSSEKIIPIARTLKEGNMLRQVNLALQSLDDDTLNINKRANMKFDKYSELTNTFRNQGFPTFTELIRGLPGETLESFKNGLQTVITDTGLTNIYVYNCSVYVNAPMNDPKYIKEHKIKTVKSPMWRIHTNSTDVDKIQEYEDLIISTSTFTQNEAQEMYYFTWAIISFHLFGILDNIGKLYQKKYSLSLKRFYEIFLDFCRQKDSLFSEEFKKAEIFVQNGYSGKGWDHHDPDLGEIFWPIEEASWLRLVKDSVKLKKGIRLFVQYLENQIDEKTPEDIIDDLIKFQIFLLTTKNIKSEIKSEEFKYNWKE